MLKLLKSTFVDALRVLCVVIFALTFIVTGFQLVTGKSPYPLVRQLFTQPATAAQTAPCDNHNPLDLTLANNSQLSKLAVYQQACRSYVTGTLMTFVGIPTSDQDASSEAKQVAATLKTFSSHHVQPLVMAEPRDYTTDQLVDMGKFAQGDYSSQLAAMFAGLKQQGIKPEQMGIWNPLPEANLPQWSDNQPQYFAPGVNAFVSTLEQYFPGTKTSIMLSSASYSPSDTALKNGQYVSLLPYLKGITAGSIDYAGVEGFPWLAPRGQAGAMVDASIYLKPSIVSEAADYLGTKNIWLNTGTFSEQYTQKTDQTVGLTAAQRQIILQDIDAQALTLKRQGYTVAVNLFAQDKSNSVEGINWSYWSGSDPSASDATPAFTGFVRTLSKQQIDFWLFDQ